MRKDMGSALAASVLLFALLLTSFGGSLAARAAGEVVTNDASNVSEDNATLNGTVGPADAEATSFWVSTSTIDTSDTTIGDGVYSTPVLDATASSTSFSASLSSLTTSGVPSDMPAVTPNTTYYYVAWAQVGGTWYPGGEEAFTTDASPAANLVLTVPSTTVEVSALVPSTNGKANDNAAVQAAVASSTPITVSLKNTGDADSENVRIAPVGDTSGHIQLWAKDTAGNWYDINVTGWGPMDGFSVEAGTTNTTDVYVISDKVDNYSSTIKVVEADSPSTVVTSANGEVTVTDEDGNAVPACQGGDETFDGFNLGSVNNQHDWTATNDAYDQEIVTNSYGYTTLGCKLLRVSNAVASGSFADWIFAAPTEDAVGEADSTEGAYDAGDLQKHFDMEFTIAAASEQVVPGITQVSVSPDRGDGSRMSYLRFDDTAAGISIRFIDVTSSGAPGTATFRTTELGVFSRTVPHDIKLLLNAVEGPSNDIVKVFVDGDLEHTGTSWEDYYRYHPEAAAEQSPRIVNTMLIQARNTGNAAADGYGFLFDDVVLTSSTDTAGPVITLEGDDTMTVAEDSTFTDPGATAEDARDGSVEVTVGGDTVNTAVPGIYVITYDAVDSAGNPATQVTRTVIVDNRRVGGGGGGGSSRSGSSNNSSNDNDDDSDDNDSDSDTSGDTNGGGEVLGEATFVFNQDLFFGLTNSDVTELQKILITKGYLKIEAPTGYFGPLTRAAVAAYQAANGITPTAGYFGPITRALMNSGK